MSRDLETKINSERLRLIPINESHTDDIFENFNEEVTKYMYPAPIKSREEAAAVVDSFITKRKKGLEVVYAITLSESGEFIGVAGLHGIKEEVPELGIWTKTSSHGNHYGREAVGAVIEYAGVLGIEKLMYPVDKRNTPSRKIPIYYGGILIRENETEITPDGRELLLETYILDTAEN